MKPKPKIITVSFDLDTQTEIEAANDLVKSGTIKGRTKKQKLANQLKYELDKCAEIRGTFKIDGCRFTAGNGCKIIVKFKFVKHTPDDPKELMVTLLQYGYDRYGWSGSFNVLKVA